MHNIPQEFKDYMASKPGLTAEEEQERLVDMRVDEIICRAKTMANLSHDKETVATRMKRNCQWAHELGELPSFHKSIDTIVEDVYKKLKIS